MGSAVPSYNWPTGAAISTAPMVETAATTEAAIPATWPMCCSAIAFRLPKVTPAMKNTLTAQKKKAGKRSGSGSRSPQTRTSIVPDTTTCIA